MVWLISVSTSLRKYEVMTQIISRSNALHNLRISLMNLILDSLGDSRLLLGSRSAKFIFFSLDLCLFPVEIVMKNSAVQISDILHALVPYILVNP